MLASAAILLTAGALGSGSAKLYNDGFFGSFRNDATVAARLMEEGDFPRPMDGVKLEFHRNEYGKLYLTFIRFDDNIQPFVFHPGYNPNGTAEIQKLIDSDRDSVYWHQVSTLNVKRHAFESMPSYLKRVHTIADVASKALILPQSDK